MITKIKNDKDNEITRQCNERYNSSTLTNVNMNLEVKFAEIRIQTKTTT